MPSPTSRIAEQVVWAVLVSGTAQRASNAPLRSLASALHFHAHRSAPTVRVPLRAQTAHRVRASGYGWRAQQQRPTHSPTGLAQRFGPAQDFHTARGHRVHFGTVVQSPLLAINSHPIVHHGQSVTKQAMVHGNRHSAAIGNDGQARQLLNNTCEFRARQRAGHLCLIEALQGTTDNDHFVQLFKSRRQGHDNEGIRGKFHVQALRRIAQHMYLQVVMTLRKSRKLKASVGA